MTSQINYALINTAFPAAGQDNSSQGFRDNFAATAAGLAQAKTELTQLQRSAILAVDLATGTQPVTNDLLGSTLQNGIYNRFYGQYYAATNNSGISGAANIDLTNGMVQKFVLSGNAVLTFTNWPASGTFANVRVLIASNQLGVWVPTFQTANAGTIRYDINFPYLPGSTTTQGIQVGGEGVKSIAVTNPGSGFTSPTTVTFTGGSPQTGASTPTATATYKVVSLTVSAGGTGFSVGDTLVCVSSSDIIATVSAANAGVITGVTLTSGGNQTSPISGTRTFIATNGTGSGCRLTVVSGINTINVTYQGDGYTTVAPTIGTTGGGGSGVVATATLTSLTADNINAIEASTIDGGANVFIRFLGEY